ncbi:MAG: extracellular solute-binding protein [Clostridia bacterium]|nr:extracellular solute-binding protein [Lachnospiraceae bacterium]NCB99893.1 extracellular solute-binding protein [Clostridia bacterium]NCD03082.1 extracellular solute-binding protein [Clostridia bacterium]
MKKHVYVMVVAIVCLILVGCGKKSTEYGLDPKNPITLQVLTYYNGAPQIALNELVTEFNNTVGAEKGIFVEAATSGGLNELTEALNKEAAKTKEEMALPDIFCCYGDVGYDLKKLGALADLSPYVTDEELAEYVPAYIEEGRLGTEDGFYVFPTAKSTEIMSLNKTDWDKFAEATGASLESLLTWEGLTETAEAYYEWSGGRAFFGRDAVSNYMLVGLHQLGADAVSVVGDKAVVNIDEAAMKRLWDNYYIPYISGYFSSVGRFRSDDMKTGTILALVGSSSGSAYLPSKVTVGDAEPYPIEVINLPVPNFSGENPMVIQQGAGMAVADSTETKEYAATIFLKWLTDEENNCKFAVASSYMPVKTEAVTAEKIETAAKANDMEWNEVIKSSMNVFMNDYSTYELFWVRPFDGASGYRSILENKMVNQSTQDRQKVVDLMSAGKDLQTAVAEINTEENFKNWCRELKEELEKACE